MSKERTCSQYYGTQSMFSNKLPLLMFLHILLIYSSVSVAQESWAQWRGPQRTGVIQNSHWPDSFDKKNLSPLWSSNFEPSYSGPLIVDGLVYTTETQDKKWEVVTALDLNTGTKRWERKWEGAMTVPFYAKANGDWIRATPAIHKGRLYVAGMKDRLVCLDAKSGKILWVKDFVNEFKTPIPSFGYVSSPLPDGDFLYVQAGGGVVKLHAETGEVLWRSLSDNGGTFGAAFSSPIIETLHGERQLIVQTRQHLAGLDIESGSILWKQEVPAFRGMNIITPCRYKSGFFISAYGGGTSYLEIQKTENGYRTQEKWKTTIQGYMSTPIIVGKYAYMHLRNQRVTCIDIETGKTQWTSTPLGKYWSMVSDGNRILALDESGTLHLLNANPEKLEILDSYKLDTSNTWAHIGIVNGHILIRDLRQLICLKWKENISITPSNTTN